MPGERHGLYIRRPMGPSPYPTLMQAPGRPRSPARPTAGAVCPATPEVPATAKPTATTSSSRNCGPSFLGCRRFGNQLEAPLRRDGGIGSEPVVVGQLSDNILPRQLLTILFFSCSMTVYFVCLDSEVFLHRSFAREFLVT